MFNTGMMPPSSSYVQQLLYVQSQQRQEQQQQEQRQQQQQEGMLGGRLHALAMACENSSCETTGPSSNAAPPKQQGAEDTSA